MIKCLGQAALLEVAVGLPALAVVPHPVYLATQFPGTVARGIVNVGGGVVLVAGGREAVFFVPIEVALLGEALDHSM